MKKSVLLVLALFMGSSCKDTDYGYVNNEPAPVKITNSLQVLKELITESDPIDILWVVDNSGSMDDIQKNIIKNTGLFIDEFVINKTVNWKMGLLSTDTSDGPYLGFSSPFDYTTSDATTIFQQAITSLGISGSGYEKTIEPIVENLKDYPEFLRPEAQLAIIMVTDEKEQTEDSYLKKEEFLQEMIQLKGSSRLLKFYAIMDARDLNCPSASFDELDYFGSKFEYLVNETGGSYFGACAEDFGKELAKISEDIVSGLANSKYFLAKRPKVDSIKVMYEGNEIPAKDELGNRKWFYNKELNCLVFTDLSFLPVDLENVNLDITFDIDDGF